MRIFETVLPDIPSPFAIDIRISPTVKWKLCLIVRFCNFNHFPTFEGGSVLKWANGSLLESAVKARLSGPFSSLKRRREPRSSHGPNGIHVEEGASALVAFRITLRIVDCVASLKAHQSFVLCLASNFPYVKFTDLGLRLGWNLQIKLALEGIDDYTTRS